MPQRTPFKTVQLVQYRIPFPLWGPQYPASGLALTWRRFSILRIVALPSGPDILNSTCQFSPLKFLSMKMLPQVPGDKCRMTAVSLVFPATETTLGWPVSRGGDNGCRRSHSIMTRFASSGVSSKVACPPAGNTTSSDPRNLRFSLAAEFRLTVQSRSPHTSSVGIRFTRRRAANSLALSANQQRIMQRTCRNVSGFRRPSTISCKVLSTTRSEPP